MDKKLLLGAVAVVLIIGILYLLDENTPGTYDEFAECLSENNVTMYGTFWCPHCKNQKEMFGKSWKFVDYVECSTDDYQQTQVCLDAGIRGYPTWEFSDGSRQAGEITIDRIALASGCKLPA